MPQSTDVDVEHDIQPEKIDAAQRRCRAAPMPRSGRVTFLQHCILYATSHQSRAAAREGRKPALAGAQPTRAQPRQRLRQYVTLTFNPRYQSRDTKAAQRRTTYTSTPRSAPATICRIDLLLASCIQPPVTCI
jgi:hypothetical protein